LGYTGKKIMKKSLLLSIIFSAITIIAIAQTKPTTTTKPATTTTKPATTTKPKTTTTVKKAPVKPAAKSTVAKPVKAAPAVVTPVETPKEVVAPTPPAEVVKEPSGPPVTGPLGDGPKSYQAEPATKSKTIGSTAKPAKTAAAKPEKVRKNNVSDDGVRSYIGIRGGYNLASAEGLDADLGAGAKLTNLAGYMGGIVINIGVSKAFSIQPEILYSQQGVQADFSDGYGKLKQTLVNVPLLLKVAFGSPKIKFFINAGPYIGYKLSQSSEISALGEVTKTDVEFVKEYDSDGIKDNLFDFGGIGGAGLQFGLGRALLTLEGRYQYGMADPSLYKDGIPAEITKNYGHQRVMTGTVGLLFPLGGK
jgi:hypothetical protein